MSEHSIVVGRFPSQGMKNDHEPGMTKLMIASGELAASITKGSSEQTYYTIRLLADRPLRDDAYRAYAYFRWVDDILDEGRLTGLERKAFLQRQEWIIARCYQGEWPGSLSAEERLVADLIQADQRENSGLRAYIDHMIAVMAFDANRKGQIISQEELTTYTRHLATAVTEALHYFIGHGSASPQNETRYLAVTAAHITHMLRDAIDDAAVGYYNVPREFLESHGIAPTEVDSEAYRSWVRSQVQLARDHFRAGRIYMTQVENLRCRVAGYAYIARFEVVLDAIERDNYRLRADYPERKSLKAGLRMVWSALSQAFDPAPTRPHSAAARPIIPEGAL